ncbi:MAG: c-type cytochrome [Rhodothermales bacterium]|nr:c-type cytochrome [Rhodothermales bacterium]
MKTASDIIRAIGTSAYSDAGSVAYLVEKPAPGVHRPAESVRVLEGSGFEADHPRKSFWKGAEIPGREVTAISIEALRAMGGAPDVTGDNLVTRGIDLGGLKPGDQLVSSEVVLQRSDAPHRPCALFRSRLGQDAFEAAAAGHRGALFVVVRGGSLRVGDQLRVVRAGETASGGGGAAALPGLVGLVLAIALMAGCSEPTDFGQTGSEVYAATCATCHGPDGMGVNQAFPPLRDSPWVSLPDSLLIRLTLRGLRGPIRVGEQRYNNVMPPHNFLSDDQLAAVLTFVRREFAASEAEIVPAQVARERERYERGPMWTIDGLTAGEAE